MTASHLRAKNPGTCGGSAAHDGDCRPVHPTARPTVRRFVPALALLVGAVASLLLVADAFPQVAGGRPAMLRTNPRIDEIRLEVELFQQASVDPRTGQVTVNGQQLSNLTTTPTYQASGVSIGVPVLVRTSWCDTDFSKYGARATVDGRDIALDPAKVFVRTAGSAEAMLRYELPFDRGAAENVLVRGIYQVQRWRLSVDEQAAAAVTWPREWPKGMERFLKAEYGIDPANARVKSVAEGATKGGPRAVTPYVAARNAVLAIAPRWRITNSATSVYGQKGALRGIAFSDGTPWGIEAGGGMPVELAATCVAALRSIGVPSRIVYCLEHKNDTTGRERKGLERRGGSMQFHFMCEFFVPDIGWIPFNPLVIRQQSTNTGAGAVKGFANVDDIEKLLPIAYQLVPEGYAMADRYALWGWKGGVEANADRAVSRIGFDDSGRGSGKVPQMPAPVSDEAP